VPEPEQGVGEPVSAQPHAQPATEARTEEEVSADFHRLYHTASDRTWQSTAWMGVNIQKLPTDLVTMQEIIFRTRPELIVETGVRRGGTTLYFASLFDLIGSGNVIGVDVDLADVEDRVRSHERVELVEGSSVDPSIVEHVKQRAAGKRVMVDLDSDHSAGHVRDELEVYAPLVSPGCYLIVEDTNLNGNPVVPEFGPGPKEALDDWLATGPPFDVDTEAERLFVTFNPGGYLRRREG
jgi:cephalosporin hydroxylase